MKKKFYSLCGLLLTATWLLGQSITPLLFGLSSPLDVNVDATQNLWITEAGTGNDDGQIIRLNLDLSLDTIITGLPSYFNVMAEELQGALSARMMADGRIFVNQGAGIDSLSSSVLEFHIDDYLAKGSALHLEDARSAVMVGAWALSHGYDESNPYAFVFDAEENYIISDAAANSIFKYDILADTFSVLFSFPSFPNPAPFGPPFIEHVPTKILNHPDGGYLVCNLTGFPFLDGAASVRHIDDNGNQTIFADNLTLLTDMEFSPIDNSLIVHQFGRFGQVNDSTLSFLFGSAQSIRIDENGQRDTLITGTGPGAGVTMKDDGTMYMTHLFLGQLLQIDSLFSATSQLSKGQQSTVVFPNPSDGCFTTEINLPHGSRLAFKVMTSSGQIVDSGDLGYRNSGPSEILFDLRRAGLSAGTYFLLIESDNTIISSQIIIQSSF
jgi:hypothetical protein